MATVTSDVLELTLAGIKTVVDASYTEANMTANWREVADEELTTLPIQNYAWLGRSAVMKQFIDEPIEQSVEEFKYLIADKTWQADLVIKRETLEDDQYGLLFKRAGALGKEPTRHWNKLTYQGLALGFTTGLGYDGLSFFNSSHVDGIAAAQSNTSTLTLNDTNLQSAEAAMMAFVDDKNEPLEIVPDTLVVGPALKRRAEDLVGSMVVIQKVGDGAIGSGATTGTNYDNYFRGKYKVVVSPYLIGTYAYYWFLCDCSRGVKPIVMQNRSDVPITMETDMDVPGAKIKGRYSFTVRGRYNQGYALWQTAYGNTATS